MEMSTTIHVGQHNVAMFTKARESQIMTFKPCFKVVVENVMTVQTTQKTVTYYPALT